MDVEPGRLGYFFVACGCWGESAGPCVNRQRRRTSEDVSVFEGEFRTCFPTLGTFYPTRYNQKVRFRWNTPACSSHSCVRLFYPGFYIWSSDIWSLQIKYHYHSFFTLHTSLHSPCAPPLPCSPLLSPTPTRPACYFFVQGPVIKFDISTGIKYAVGEGEKGALLQSQGQL